MDITLRPTESITPYEHNPRVNDGAVDAVAASLKAFGFRQPIVVDAEDVIVVGHTRWKAARKLGLAMVPVHVAADLTPAQARAYRIADNATNELAEWDKLLLPAELQGLQAMDVDLGLLGFDPAELDRLLVGEGKDGLTDPDDVPPVPAEPVTQPGDLWTLGDHRVLCGDSTVVKDVERLLDGAVPFLMVTDPPYGVSYNPEWRHQAGLNESSRTGKVQNDDRVDWTDAYRLFPGHVAYVWHAGVHASEVSANLQAAGFGVRAQIIWRKPRFVIGRGAYHWGHEPCWYAVREGGSAKWCGDRSQSTVWDIAQRDDTGDTVHGTQKPVECMARPVRNHGGKEDAVYDPFLGSGTTVMAAEQLGRRCCGMEISPGYVDVIVQRWEAFTGKRASRVDGKGKKQPPMTDNTPAEAGVVEGVGR
ncbi:MAG TPA: DNA methyltransferase [Tepidisphaeraceae bacterium]|jgi:DNA modification methylase|nr:DNA methyltransferase [Tepidisphaeraceae bacterium]